MTFFSLPVVDEDNQVMVFVTRRIDVIDALMDEAAEDFGRFWWCLNTLASPTYGGRL